MKRSWTSIIAVAAVLGLLTLFLGLQYRWLSEANEAERERMQKRAETDVARFAEDFNREMQAAYYNFQTGSAMWRSASWNQFNERYDFWKERTTHPDLIRDIYFFERESGKQPLKYNAANRVFESAETSVQLENLRARFTDEKTFRPVYEDAYAMVLPIHNNEKPIIVDHIMLRRTEVEGPKPMMKMPEAFGWLVILLDETTIKNSILPELAAKYFPDRDYEVTVFDRDEQAVFAEATPAGNPDAKSALFDLSPDNLMFFSSREMIPRTGPQEKRRDFVINQRVESHTFSSATNEGKAEKFNVEVQGPVGKPRTAMIATTSAGGAPWTLKVQHAAGSIDAFVQGERNKSFLIGLGVYVLLVGGILAIVLSSLRSRAFARRQIDFVSSVSHEFRTPLAVIYTAGENLADGVTKEQSQILRYGELIKGEGKKLSAMVEQILEFAGANSGRRNLSFSHTGVGEIVKDAIEECRPLIESGGFKLETDLPDDLPVMRVDRNALSGAIQNLIANSVKYSNGSKWIRVSAVNANTAVKIAVEDKGIGIRGDEQGLIFEPFFRSKDVVDAQISGNGLGLNLVKKIAEAHGGKVTVVSEAGNGAVFTIELPLTAPR